MQVRMLLALVCSLAVACGGGESGSRQPARPVTPRDLSTTGTIAVDVGGTVPPMQGLRRGGFAECAAQHAGPVPAGDMLVKDGHVENAFVYIKSGLGDRVFAVPTEPVVIDQKGCQYVPRVAGAQV